MASRDIMLVTAGLVIGAAVVLLIPWKSGESLVPVAPVVVAPFADGPGATASQTGAGQPEVGERNAAPPGDVGALGHENPPSPEPIQNHLAEQDSAEESPTFEEELRELGETRQAGAAQRENSRLLEAGFSQERIDWLKRRRGELLAQQEQVDHERRQSGAPRHISTAGALLMERDLFLLRDEMSDDEYANYRQALGRSTAFSVEEVLPGSYADRAGIVAGDQVVRYDGRRVFNIVELDALATNDASGGFAVVELLREGQTIVVSLPRGPTGLRAPNALASDFMNRLRQGMRSD